MLMSATGLIGSDVMMELQTEAPAWSAAAALQDGTKKTTSLNSSSSAALFPAEPPACLSRG